MRVKSDFLKRFHLDKKHMLLTARGVQVVQTLFQAMDISNTNSIDDIQFLAFLKTSTDLSDAKCEKVSSFAIGLPILRNSACMYCCFFPWQVFDMFDVDSSGRIDFDEFYLLVCMLIAIKDKVEKQFVGKHSRTCFELLDEDGSESLTIEEVESLGFIFNFGEKATAHIWSEFSVDGNKSLDYEEFRMFTLACIDKERELQKEKEQRKLKNEDSSYPQNKRKRGADKQPGTQWEDEISAQAVKETSNCTLL